MTRDEYVQTVQGVLNSYTEEAASRLIAVLALVPPKAKRVILQIFVDQDGEGFLDARVSLDGPDLVSLHRAIAPHAELFGTKMTENGFDPALPLMEPGRETFSVQDALTDSAAGWLASVWKRIDRGTFTLPVAVESPDGYGTNLPLELQEK